jgi:hypothetical protein
MRLRTLVLSVLAALAIAVPASADLVTENAQLTYNLGAKRWDFLTDTFVSGSINILGKGVAKQLAKLKLTGYSHSCLVTYDSDSKIDAGNGSYYSIFKMAKCDA